MKGILSILFLCFSLCLSSQEQPNAPMRFSLSVSVNAPVIGIRIPMKNSFEENGFNDASVGFFGRVQYPTSNSSITLALNADYLITKNVHIGLRVGQLEKAKVSGFKRDLHSYYSLDYQVLEITPYAKWTTNNNRVFAKGGAGLLIINSEEKINFKTSDSDYQNYRPGITLGVGWNLVQSPRALLTLDIAYKGVIGKIPLGLHRADIQGHSLLAGISAGIRF